MTVAAGTRLGRYEILSPLGAGGMGEVYRARDTRLGRFVALKVLPPDRMADPERRQRFVQEARAASALNNPHIVTVHDIDEADGVHFIAMEYVEGRPLAERLRGEPLPVGEIVRLGTQVAEALQAAHACGVVHRDVKPANVMVTSAGLVKVVDFGLAQFRGPGLSPGEDSVALTLTRPGTVVGTVAYMSPEQAVGAPVDHRTDLFSLGVVLYRAATGCLPFAGSTELETIERIRHAEPESITRLNAGIPAELARIVRKCIAKEADRRYQSAQELLIDLEALAQEGEASRRDPGPEDGGCHNFPADVSSFVGRRHEVDELVGLVGSSRLLTLTGSGGCGKTRLALQLGERVGPTFAAGAWFVDLTPISDPGLLVDVVARAVGVVEKAGAALRDALVEWLAARHVLLVLDNCEHLVAHCAELAESLLRKAPQLRIVATSREALGVPGESVWRVPSLALPGAGALLRPDEALGFDAVRLFAERAAAVAPFTLTAENATTVVEICRRLDGMPLAIELAAARVRILSVEQIRDRLYDQFRLLTGGGRTAVARQRTLEATVDWSYELLAEDERRLLARLSVFAGGWTLEAAEQVCSGDGIDESAVLDLLTRLVDKSLVVVEHGTEAERRYRLLEVIRQYGRDRLIRSQEVQSVAGRHFSYFLSLARRAQPELSGADQVAWLERLDTENDNLRAAIEWGMADPVQRRKTLSLATSLWWFWTKRGYFREGEQRLEEVLAANSAIAPRAEAHTLVGLMHLASFRGETEKTRDIVDRCLSRAREAGDRWAESFALCFGAILESDRGDFARSVALATEAREIAPRTTHLDTWMPSSLALRMIAYGAIQSGDLQQGGRLFEQVIDLNRRAGNTWSLGILVADLAGLRVLEKRHDEAAVLAREALVYGRSLNDRRGIGWSLQAIAMVEAVAGRAERAAWLLGAAESALESVGAKGQVTVTRVQDRYLASARDSMGEYAFQRAVEAGRAMPLERAIDMALGQPN